MTTQHKSLRLSALSLALMSAFGVAQAEEDAAVTELTTPTSSISVGAGYWSSARPQQGIYDGMREKGTYGALDIDVTKLNKETGTWTLFRGSNLGLDTREIRADYIRQGNFGGFLEYSKTPRKNPYTINTPLQGIGTTNLTVGTNLGSFPTREVELGTVREMFRLGGSKSLTPGLEFKLDFKNEDKTGTRQTGWGSAPLFSVEPINSTTRQLDAILQYSRDKLQLNGGYAGSWYDNQNPQILQTLNGVSGGTSASFNSVTPLSQPLSNQAHQFFMGGGYGFTSTTRGTFKLAYTEATQDEHLPSYDLGGANVRFVNAPSHLDGKVASSLMQMGLSSRPTPKLLLTTNWRYYDVNDKTPLAGYVGSNTTGVASVYNTPHSFTTNSGKVEANYRLPQRFNVTGGVDYSNQDRSAPVAGTVYVPFRHEVTELTYRAELRRTMSDDLNGSLGYFRSDRDGSDYTQANGTPYANQITPIHIADRERDKWRAKMDWDPLENLSLQFRVDYAQDKYPHQSDRPYGPTEGNNQIYALDVSYTLSENWVFTGWYAHDITNTESTGYRAVSSNAANATRNTHLRDTGDSLGFGLRTKLSAKLEGGVGVDWFRSTSSYNQNLALEGTGTAYPTGTTGPLDDVHTNLLRFKLDAKYALDKASDLRFDFVYERWSSNDWSWEFANGSTYSYYSGTQACAGCTGAGYTGVVDGTTVSAKEKQSSVFVGIRYIYKFQ